MYELHSQKELKQTFREGGKYEEQLRENFRFGRFIESGMMDEYLDAQLSQQGELPRDLMELSAVGCQASMSLTEQDFEGRISLSASKLTESDSDAMKVLAESSISDRRRTQRERKRHLRKCKKLQKSALSDMKKAAKKKERGKDSIEERCDAIMSAAEAQKEYLKATCKDPKTEEYLLACADIRTCRRVLAICQDAPGYKKLAEKTQSLLDKSMQKLTTMEQFRTKWQEMNADEQAQKALDQQSMQKILDQSAQTLRFGDLEGVTLEDFSAELLRTDKSMIARFVADNTAEMQAEKEKADLNSAEVAKFDAMLDSLRQHRLELAGGDEFGLVDPQFTTKAETICGLSTETIKSWLNKQYENTKLSFYKKTLRTFGSWFGLDIGTESEYERAYLNLLSMRELAKYKERIINAYTQYGGNVGNAELAKLTRLTGHPVLNSSETYRGIITNAVGLYIEQFDVAVSRQKEAEFFSKLQGACFEDRIDQLTDYAMRVAFGKAEPYDEPLQYFTDLLDEFAGQHPDQLEITQEDIMPFFRQKGADKTIFPNGTAAYINFTEAKCSSERQIPLNDDYYVELCRYFKSIGMID